ncbi:hypothetical protein BSKO_01851 [Bryopsis sp. KO-2023]|nr:hypothetical protein BSKO_01851 [Bryopsis sp. KO-2023]
MFTSLRAPSGVSPGVASGSDERVASGRPDVSCRGIRLPGLLSAPTPILEPEQAMARVGDRLPSLPRDKFHAFFSSDYGGIVKDPLYMTLPIDDRMVTLGHGAFDMCLMTEGYLYSFEEHLDRFEQSIGRAGLEAPFSRRSLQKTILHTAAASTRLNGFVRFWVTGGRGTFGLSPKGGSGPSLYVLASDEDDFRKVDITVGWKAKTTPVPPHEPYFLSTLSNSFLPGVLATMDAEASKYEQGIFVDSDGHVLNAGNASVGIVTHDGELVVPPNEDVLCGLTMEKILSLVPKLNEPKLSVKTIERRLFTVEEAKSALEVFVAGINIPVTGITHWDGDPIADGTTGVNTLVFNAQIYKDAEYRPESPFHTEVPYGYMTGMEEEEPVFTY